MRLAGVQGHEPRHLAGRFGGGGFFFIAARRIARGLVLHFRVRLSTYQDDDGGK